MQIRLAFPDRNNIDIEAAVVPREGDCFTWLDRGGDDHLYSVDHVEWVGGADGKPLVAVLQLMYEEHDGLEEQVVKDRARIAAWLRDRAAEIELDGLSEGTDVPRVHRMRTLREEADRLDTEYMQALYAEDD